MKGGGVRTKTKGGGVRTKGGVSAQRGVMSKEWLPLQQEEKFVGQL